MYRRNLPASRVVPSARSAVESLEVRRLFALTTFTIDPTLSSLRLSGKVADVFDIEEQHDGSLVQGYQGSIVANVQDGVVTFPGGSSVVAQATKKYDPGSGLANYGAKGETGGFISVELGEAAIRNFAFDLNSTDLALAGSGAFGAGGLKIHTAGGKLDYDLRVGGDGSSDLDDKDTGNDATGNATLRGDNGNQTLTIPLDFSFEAASTELRLRGTLVATVGSGAPVDPNVVRIGAGTLLKSVEFTDADGTVGTVTLSGGGTADVQLSNATQQTPGKAGAVIVGGQNVSILGIDVVSTTTHTKLAIAGKGGTDNVIAVPSLTTDGSVGTVGGKGVVLSGNVTIGGTLGTLTATRLTSATLTADSLGTVKLGGDVSNSTITLAAPFAAGTFAVRSFTAVGAFDTSRLSATGAIGTVKVKSMTGSAIESGVAAGAAQFPATADLSSGNSIVSLTVAKNFADSVVAADALGKLKFGTIRTDNGGTVFGITAQVIAGLTAQNQSKQKLKLALTDSAATLTAELALQRFTFGDFAIRLG